MRTSIVSIGLVGITLLASACSTAAETSDSSLNGQTRAAVCSPEQQASAWAHMVTAPVVPPRSFGGIDVSGGETWQGLTIEGAEQTLCQARPLGGDESGSRTYAWGDADEVLVQTNGATNKIEFIQLNQGFRGTLDFKSRPDGATPNPFGQHTYAIGVGVPLRRDGQTWEFDWTNKKQATELFDAMMATFAPELPSTQDNCIADQTCVSRRIGEEDAYFGVRPLGMYFHVGAPDAPQPAASTPDYLYSFYVKMMPFSNAQMLLKLDDEGPVASANGLGVTGRKCTMKLGMSYSTFLDGCINIAGDEATNERTRKKFLGGANVKDGVWSFDVAGARPNFAGAEGETAPSADAKASQLELDLRSIGRVLNDYASDRTTFTFGGTAAVYREYARLVQESLHGLMDPSRPVFGIGASECLLPAGADPAAWRPADGCTGIEQMVTPALPDTQDAGINKMSVGPSVATSLGFRSALKPGDPIVAFCADPGTFDYCGWSDDESAPGYRGSLWQGTLDQVTKVLGKGSVDNVPRIARSTPFYVALWAKALVKYFNAASLAPTDLSRPEFDRFMPASSDISLSGIRTGGVTVSYKNKLSIRLIPEFGNVQQFVFKR